MKEQLHKEEVFKCYLPAEDSSSHIFNDKYEVLSVRDKEGDKIIILRRKEIK